MNPNVRLLFTFLLRHNLALVACFGLLLPIAAGWTLRSAMRAGAKHAVVLVFTGILGSAVFSALPAGMEFLGPVVIMAFSITAAAVLRAWGALPATWAGMPGSVLALGPSAGIQAMIWSERLSGLDAVLASFGAGIGYYAGILVIVATIEQIRMAEAPAHAKTLGTLLFALSILALALAGFLFL